MNIKNCSPQRHRGHREVIFFPYRWEDDREKYALPIYDIQNWIEDRLVFPFGPLSQKEKNNNLCDLCDTEVILKVFEITSSVVSNISTP